MKYYLIIINRCVKGTSTINIINTYKTYNPFLFIVNCNNNKQNKTTQHIISREST